VNKLIGYILYDLITDSDITLQWFPQCTTPRLVAIVTRSPHRTTTRQCPHTYRPHIPRTSQLSTTTLASYRPHIPRTSQPSTTTLASYRPNRGQQVRVQIPISEIRKTNCRLLRRHRLQVCTALQVQTGLARCLLSSTALQTVKTIFHQRDIKLTRQWVLKDKFCDNCSFLSLLYITRFIVFVYCCWWHCWY